MHLSPGELRKRLEEIDADDEAQALRERVAKELAARLAENGLRLSIHHRFGGDRAGLGFATITEMAAELAEGAIGLYKVGLWYPGAALVRQLIECGYLLALCEDRRDEAADWLEASPAEIRAEFTPQQMRDRATHEFRDREYWTHADQGGHPNPAGRGLLRHHEEWRPFSTRSLWVDLAQHVAETWESFCRALPLYDPRTDPTDPLHSPERSPDGGPEAAALLKEWRQRDSLANRSPVPEH